MMTSSELSNALPLMMACEEVESNDDLLMQILFRLPLGLLYKLIWVSHRWKRIITCSSYFRNNYEARLRKQERFPLLAFIQSATPFFLPKRCARSGSHPPPMNILPIDPNHHKYVLPCVDQKYGFFFASSNGLVLTGYCKSVNTYYVMNLVTRWCSPPLHVPKLPSSQDFSFPDYDVAYKSPLMTMIYEPEHEQVYRVVAVPSLHFPVRVYPIKIYSSNTHEWTDSKLMAAQRYLIRPTGHRIIAFNGVLHLFSSSPFCLVLLKTKDLIVDGENNVQLIMLPDIDELTFKAANYNFCRSSSDELLFGTIDDANSKLLRIWLLPEQHSSITAVPNTEWRLTHTIDLDPVRKDIFPLVVATLPNFKREKHRQYQRETILSEKLKLEALITWNGATFVLFRFRKSIVENRIILYELQSKSVELVKYVGTSKSDEARYGAAYNWYPYIEPITMSSYFSNI